MYYTVLYTVNMGNLFIINTLYKKFIHLRPITFYNAEHLNYSSENPESNYFSASLLQSSVSQDPSEIILIR